MIFLIGCSQAHDVTINDSSNTADITYQPTIQVQLNVPIPTQSATWVPVILNPVATHIPEEVIASAPVSRSSSQTKSPGLNGQLRTFSEETTSTPNRFRAKESLSHTAPTDTPPVVAGFEDYYDLAETYFQQQQYQDTIDNLDSVMQRQNNSSDGYFLRGRAHYQIGNYELALRDFNLSIRLNDSEARYYFHRGGVFKSQQNFNNALHDYDKAIKLASETAEPYIERAAVYRELGEIKKSNIDFVEACAIDEVYCRKLDELKICSKDDLSSTHSFFGLSTVVDITVRSADKILVKTRLLGTPISARPYYIELQLCNDQLDSLIGQSIQFEHAGIVISSGHTLIPGEIEEIDLDLPGPPPPTPEGYIDPLPTVFPTPLPQGDRISPDGMVVTLYSAKIAEISNLSYMQINYSLRNITGDKLSEKSWKLYFHEGGGIEQQFSLDVLLPGQVLTRQYMFTFEQDQTPFVLGYPSQKNDLWNLNDLTWQIGLD